MVFGLSAWSTTSSIPNNIEKIEELTNPQISSSIKQWDLFKHFEKRIRRKLANTQSL